MSTTEPQVIKEKIIPMYNPQGSSAPSGYIREKTIKR